MSEIVTKVQAISRFFNSPCLFDGTTHEVKATELMGFKKACTPEEWDYYTASAAKILGATLSG